MSAAAAGVPAPDARSAGARTLEVVRHHGAEPYQTAYRALEMELLSLYVYHMEVGRFLMEVDEDDAYFMAENRQITSETGRYHDRIRVLDRLRSNLRAVDRDNRDAPTHARPMLHTPWVLDRNAFVRNIDPSVVAHHATHAAVQRHRLQLHAQVRDQQGAPVAGVGARVRRLEGLPPHEWEGAEYVAYHAWIDGLAPDDEELALAFRQPLSRYSVEQAARIREQLDLHHEFGWVDTHWRVDALADTNFWYRPDSHSSSESWAGSENAGSEGA